jgi:hypothetical protein
LEGYATLLAAKPREPKDLEAEFARLGRDFQAAMATVDHIESKSGLSVLREIRDGRLWSVI